MATTNYRVSFKLTQNCSISESRNIQIWKKIPICRSYPFSSMKRTRWPILFNWIYLRKCDDVHVLSWRPFCCNPSQQNKCQGFCSLLQRKPLFQYIFFEWNTESCESLNPIIIPKACLMSPYNIHLSTAINKQLKKRPIFTSMRVWRVIKLLLFCLSTLWILTSLSLFDINCSNEHYKHYRKTLIIAYCQVVINKSATLTTFLQENFDSWQIWHTRWIMFTLVNGVGMTYPIISIK